MSIPNQESDVTTQVKVLLIDDEISMGRVFKRILGDSMSLSMATNLTEALRIVGEEDFDAILCDVHLGPESGFDFHRQLKEQGDEQADRIIFLTGGFFTDKGADMADAIGNPVLYKPFSADDIQKAIKTLCG